MDHRVDGGIGEDAVEQTGSSDVALDESFDTRPEDGRWWDAIDNDDSAPILLETPHRVRADIA
jgi:hypothetical protein